MSYQSKLKNLRSGLLGQIDEGVGEFLIYESHVVMEVLDEKPKVRFAIS